MAKKATLQLFCEIVKMVAPPVDLRISEWADMFRILPESAAEPGQWSTDRVPYMREIMDSVTNPQWETIVVMSSAQVGKTELLLNIIGYYIHYDPSAIIMLQPTLDMGQAFSKDRLAPMINDMPELRYRVKDVKTRDSGNTILHKTFKGGSITIVGANSPTGLSGRPIRIVLADEVDRYDASAGTEGDPLALATKRTTTFWNSKKVYVSTPGDKETSRIEPAYMEGTQEQWCYPCPACGQLQPLTWGQIRFEDATHECCHCKERFDEFSWKNLRGQWKARNPEATRTRSFHLNELSSPWKRWPTIIEEFREAKRMGKESLKVWINTSLGETWEEQGDTLDAELFTKRREVYDCEVPNGVLVMTAGVDVQDDRLEVEIVGWGIGKESWGIEYKTFLGDPAIIKAANLSQPTIWEQLDRYLQKTFKFSDGNEINISCVCIDSGGHFTTEVYDFCLPREVRRIFAIKGVGGDGLPLVGKPSRSNRKKVALFPLGVDTGKEQLFSRLKTEFEGPGYCHYPREAEKGYDEGYFKGLTAEKRVIRYHKGRPRIDWVKRSGARNEPLDLRNYATAAMEILNPPFELLDENRRNPLASKAVTAPPRRRGVISKGVEV
jgi:phage terminase large subunit GpA-like protein